MKRKITVTLSTDEGRALAGLAASDQRNIESQAAYLLTRQIGAARRAQLAQLARLAQWRRKQQDILEQAAQPTQPERQP